MPIVYSAIVPHSPVFLPTIGEGARKESMATIQSFERVREHTKTAEPDTILVIAPHDESKQREANYTFHVPETYRADFSEFGDIVTKTEYSADTVLAAQLKDKLIQEKIGATYISDEKLDYSAGVPLENIVKGLQVKVLVIHPPGKVLQELFADGSQFQKILQESAKRIVCITSADLSHCVSEKAPLPFNEAGVRLDELIVKCIKSKKPKQLLAIQNELIDEVGACGVPSIALFLGIVKNLKYAVMLLSYENALGVGHITAEYTVP